MPAERLIRSRERHRGSTVNRCRGPDALTLLLRPPELTGFGRHTDRETGVPPWWEPCGLSWIFRYPSPGKP